MIYYTDTGLKKIYRARIPTNSSTLSYTQDLELPNMDKPEGIAFDWIGRNIYYSDTRYGAIYVCTEDGLHKKTLLRGGGYIPTGLAVAPVLGKLFFLDVKLSQPTIQSIYMNGDRRETLVDSNLVQPSGITIDYHQDHR